MKPVADVLPHCEPFLFLDRIASHDAKTSVGVGRFRVKGFAGGALSAEADVVCVVRKRGRL